MTSHIHIAKWSYDVISYDDGKKHINVVQL